ncbi:MAG: fumarylacetoacetate hydrolase family protein [Thermodesulfobacteriota bacterium]
MDSNLNSKQAVDSVAESDYGVFCRIARGEWRRVISQQTDGVTVLAQSFSFNEVWNYKPKPPLSHPPESLVTLPWEKLLTPLPDPHVDTWGYAMSYPSHQEEVRLEDSFHFRKFGSVVSANDDIPFRPYLDYEAEIAILMQRGDRKRFAYVMTNDLTDRGIQVRTYDADNMASGFSKAKSFVGALQAGSLLVIGNAQVWKMLEVELRLNGEMRQHLIATECLLEPGRIHDEIFSEEKAGTWVLASTGTTGGVQFSTPTIWQKIALIVASGFSRTRAADRWLEQLTFLQPGDRIDFYSAQLGRSSATVVNN